MRGEPCFVNLAIGHAGWLFTRRRRVPRITHEKFAEKSIDVQELRRIRMNHQFSLIIDCKIESEEEILDIADTLGNAECLDGSVGGHSEGVEVVFNREADSLDEAIKSAIVAIEGVGYRVKRAEMARESISLKV